MYVHLVIASLGFPWRLRISHHINLLFAGPFRDTERDWVSDEAGSYKRYRLWQPGQQTT